MTHTEFCPSVKVELVRSTRLSPCSCRTWKNYLHDSIDFRFPYTDAVNSPARLTELPGFRCPSDVHNPLSATGGGINYMANKGNGIVWRDATGPNAGLPNPNGVFYFQSAIRFGEVRDTLSNTAAFSERVLADGSNGIVSPVADVFFHPGAPVTRDEAMQMCDAIDITNLANQFPLFMEAHGSMGSTHICTRPLPTRVHVDSSRCYGP